MNITANKVAAWLLVVVIYVSILFLFTFGLMHNNKQHVDNNTKLINHLLDRKEYHIKVSEYSNNALKEILRELQCIKDSIKAQ